MKTHSMIFDDFFKDPYRAKALINQMDMSDETYKDGVTYPNIARLPESVVDEIYTNMAFIVGPAFQPVLSFARYSFEGGNPPHWAHSDRQIANYLALIYLSEGAGTCVLRHKAMDFESHPESELKRAILLSHANKRDEWEVTYECPGRFNRCFILNADLIHAAVGEYGFTRRDGRLVVSVFFNLVRQ